MKKISLIILFMLTPLCALLAQKSVFITAGQSNADGRAYNSSADGYWPSYLTSAPVYSYLHFAQIATDANPQWKNSGIGNRLAFCDVTNYYLDQRLQDDFYSVKCTYGGSAIQPGATAAKVPCWYANLDDKAWEDTAHAAVSDVNYGSLSLALVQRFRMLAESTLSKIEGGYKVRAIMWHQGESDRGASAKYYDNLKNLILYFRQRIYEITGDEDALHLPFIMGSVCRKSTQYNKTVEEAHWKMTMDLENVYCIDMSNVPLRSDNLHFNSVSTEYLGICMFNKLVELGLVPGEQIRVSHPITGDIEGGNEVAADREWNFSSPLSDSTLESIKSEWDEVAAYGYMDPSIYVGNEMRSKDGKVFPEMEGLYFTAPTASKLFIQPGSYIGILNKTVVCNIPKLSPGKYITIVTEPHRDGGSTAVTLAEGKSEYFDLIAGGETSDKRQINVWWMRDTFESPTDFIFSVKSPTRVLSISVGDNYDMDAVGVLPPASWEEKQKSETLVTMTGTTISANSLVRGVFVDGNRKIYIK